MLCPIGCLPATASPHIARTALTMNCPMALAQAAAPRTHVRGTGALADTLEDTEDPIMEQSTCHCAALGSFQTFISLFLSAHDNLVAFSMSWEMWGNSSRDHSRAPSISRLYFDFAGPADPRLTGPTNPRSNARANAKGLKPFVSRKHGLLPCPL